MTRTDRLIRRKRRLTHRLVRSDHRRVDAEKPVRAKTLVRARLYRIDTLLEQLGEISGHTWYPGAVQNPGLNAAYRRGRTLGRMIRLHFTVGTGSLGLIASKGLAQFLVDRDGTVHELAPADAVCSDACEWNIYGFGIEVEALERGQFTPPQIVSVAGVLGWGETTYEIPDDWHLGPDYDGTSRLAVGSDGRGIYNHDALHERACDEHYDGATPEERDAIRAAMGVTHAPPPIALEEDDMVTEYTNKQGIKVYFYVDDDGRFVQKSWNWPKPGQWNTYVLDGDKPGQADPTIGNKPLVDDKLKDDPVPGNVHLFARAKDGKNMAHASYAGTHWVVQAS